MIYYTFTYGELDLQENTINCKNIMLLIVEQKHMPIKSKKV